MSNQEEHVFIDVNPMLIEGPYECWQHPFIDTYYDPKDYTHDLDVYRIYLKNERGEYMRIIFKSDILDALMEDPGWDGLNLDLVHHTLLEVLYVTFIEDIWVPMPNIECENFDEVSKVRKDYKCEQFIFTEFGENLQSFFDCVWGLEFFSPDVGMTRCEDGTYGWDT